MIAKTPFIELISQIIINWKKANPIICHQLGIHDYDGFLPDYSQAAVLNRITEIENDLLELEKIGVSIINDKFSRFEFNIVKMALESELFELKDRQEFKNNPLMFIFPLTLIESSFTKRSFASIDDRISLIIDYEKKIPTFLAQAKDILNDSLPQAKILMSLQFLDGIEGYFSSVLSSFIDKSDDQEKFNSWQIANNDVLIAIRDFSKSLKEEYLPKSHTNFALGEAKFSELLKKTEFIDLPIDTLLAIGEQDLERNLNQLKSIFAEKGGKQFFYTVINDFPRADELLETIQKILDRVRQFVIDANIASIPTDDRCKVIKIPEYARAFSFANMDPPGPFELPDASEAFFQISLPDPSWNQEQTDNYMRLFNRSFLEILAIHEAWPGHYLQLLYNKSSKSDISKLFARSITMVEGWAHYCEEMVLEEGYDHFDRIKLEVGQLIGAILRNCRFISAIKMHCKGMTIDESKKLFVEKAFLPEGIAEVEARRGTIDPMYLNYTLGKLLFKKLRADCSNSLGEEFSLKKFHDTVLGFGSPPIIALRELLLDDPNLVKEIL